MKFKKQELTELVIPVKKKIQALVLGKFINIPEVGKRKRKRKTGREWKDRKKRRRK